MPDERLHNYPNDQSPKNYATQGILRVFSGERPAAPEFQHRVRSSYAATGPAPVPTDYWGAKATLDLRPTGRFARYF